MSSRVSWHLSVVVALAVVLGATGGFLIAVSQPSSGEPIAMPTVLTPSTTETTRARAPTTTGTAPAPAPTTTVAAPTTTPAPQAPPTTKATSPRPPKPPAKPVPGTARPAPSNGASQLDQVESIADSSRWDWRNVHVHFRIGFYPADCCHWGVYDPQDHKTIWIGPTAFDNPGRLRYVVLHELAHAWQWHSHRLKKLSADMAPWGYQDVDALEAGADCIGTVWGADVAIGHYWACPSAAQDLMSRRLAGQWQ